MYVHNIRKGFATNSSSTHSVIVLEHGDTTTFSGRDTYSEYNFGWEDFVCDTKSTKMEYMAAQLVTNYYGFLEDEDLKNLVLHATGEDISEYLTTTHNSREYGYHPDIHVDHQSAWHFRGFIWDHETRNTFMYNLAQYLQHDRVVVLGGNDNDGTEWNLPERVENISWLNNITDSDRTIRVRKDGSNYVFFDVQYGDKIRFSLSHDTNITPYTKSTTPELVDLKITNYCDAGCAFCYQASTIKGKHASREKIFSIIDTLDQAGVFEIAFGGGEPTQHPDFTEILRYSREHNIVPNFTTYSDKWLTDTDMVNTVRTHVGGIGVSVHNLDDIKLYRKIRSILGAENKALVMVQHVVGLLPVGDTAQLIKTCWEDGIPLLLLGYKTVGFGGKQTPYDNSTLPLYIKLLLDNKSNNESNWSFKYNMGITKMISVDTAFAASFQQMLTSFGVDPRTYSTEEGKFSCYIDATLDKMGPSSYVEVKTMDNLTLDLNDFKTKFAAY
jgi:hypothetical protein